MSEAIRNWRDDTAHLTTGTPVAPGVMFMAAGEEMLRIERDGFYVRGEAVEQTQDEARKVYGAFRKWMRAQGMAV